MAWLRLYDDILDDPKIQMLSDRAFRMLINLWCLAKRNGGLITGDLNSLSFSLRWPIGKVRDTLQALLSAGLVEQIEAGYSPHNWSGRQFISDGHDTTSAERMRRYRERNPTRDKSVTLQPSDASRDGSVTVLDTESETEQNRTDKKERAPKRAAVELPSWIPVPAWEAFLEMRKRLRAPLTDKAIQIAIGQLEKLRDVGHEPSAVLEQSTMRSWRGLFAISETSNGRAQQQGRGIRDAAEHALAAIRRGEEEGEGHRPGPQQRQALTSQNSTGAHHPGDNRANPPSHGDDGRSVPEPKSFNGGAESALPRVLRGPGSFVGAPIAGSLQAVQDQPREPVFPNPRTIVGVGKVISQ